MLQQIPFLVITLLSAHLLFGAALIYFVYLHFKIAHKKKWWDLSDRKINGRLDWNSVNKLADDDPSDDDVCRPKWRTISWLVLALEMAGLFLLSSMWISILFLIVKYGEKLHPQDIQQIGMGIGGVGVFLGFIGVIYTGRIAVRSVNRQSWINNLRDILSDLIHNIPSSVADKGTLSRAKQYAGPLIFKVELLLNPSEPDHRALIALVRHFYRIPDIGIDETARKKLGLSNEELLNKEKFDHQKSRLIRLSNAILKREWEQVKHVR